MPQDHLWAANARRTDRRRAARPRKRSGVAELRPLMQWAEQGRAAAVMERANSQQVWSEASGEDIQHPQECRTISEIPIIEKIAKLPIFQVVPARRLHYNVRGKGERGLNLLDSKLVESQ